MENKMGPRKEPRCGAILKSAKSDQVWKLAEILARLRSQIWSDLTEMSGSDISQNWSRNLVHPYNISPM